MSRIVAKKKEEQALQKIRDLLCLPENKKCFDCSTKSPFFVNVTVQTFICVRCSGLLREVGHRVKSISASKISGPELVALQQGGNGMARKIWLCGYQTSIPDPETDTEVRHFIRQKYYEKKWLDRDLLKNHSEMVKKMVIEMFTEDGDRRPGVSTPPPNTSRQLSTEGVYTPPIIKPFQAWQESKPPAAKVPIGISSPPLRLLDEDFISTATFSAQISPPPLSPSMTATPVSRENRSSTSSTSIRRDTSSSSILDELAGFDSPSSPSTHFCTGTVLVPTSPTTSTYNVPSFQSPDITCKIQDISQVNAKSERTAISALNDPYAALRVLTPEQKNTQVQPRPSLGYTQKELFSDLNQRVFSKEHH